MKVNSCTRNSDTESAQPVEAVECASSVGEGESASGEDEGKEDEVQDICDDDDDDESEDECPFDVINSKYGYNENGGSNEDEEDEVALHGVINLTEETNQLRIQEVSEATLK